MREVIINPSVTRRRWEANESENILVGVCIKSLVKLEM